jgi:protein-disulfide isomerase
MPVTAERRHRWRAVLLLGSILLMAAVALAPGAPRADEAEQREQIERVVRDLLMREPELVYDALQELQRKREVAEVERQRRVIAERRDELLYDPDTPVVGDPQGSATVVEFFDYRCGFCRRMIPTIRALLEEDGELRLVLKDLPVLGPESMVAARAALASREQDLYGPFHFALMETDDLSEENILRIAAEVGLDVERLKEDMKSSEVTAAIEENYRLARDLGIQGTPAFIIGEAFVPGAIDRAELEALIEAARAG